MTPNGEVVDTITGRAEVPGDASQLTVFFNQRDSLNVPIHVWVDWSLKIGMVVDQALMDELEEQALESEAMEVAFRFLRVKARTEVEVKQRLTKDAYPESICERVIARLIAKGFIDDHLYAEGFVDHRGARMSRRELTYRLRQKGIDESIAAVHLNSEEAAEREREAAVLLARKHWRRHRNRDIADRRNKLAYYLQSKGFRTSTIYDVLRLMEADSQESEHS